MTDRSSKLGQPTLNRLAASIVEDGTDVTPQKPASVSLGREVGMAG